MIKKTSLHPINISVSKHKPFNFPKYSRRRKNINNLMKLLGKRKLLRPFRNEINHKERRSELGREFQIFGAEKKKDLYYRPYQIK